MNTPRTVVAARQEALRKTRATEPGAFTHDLEVELSALTQTLAAFSAAETAGKTRIELDEPTQIAVIARVAKTLRRSADDLTQKKAEKAGDLTADEQIRLSQAIDDAAFGAEILGQFLPERPAELSNEALTELVAEMIGDLEPEQRTPRAVGLIMGKLKSRNDVDMATASKIARALLNQN